MASINRSPSTSLIVDQEIEEVYQNREPWSAAKSAICRIPVDTSSTLVFKIGIKKVTFCHHLTLPDGEYVGDLVDDEPHGTGTLTYKAGMERKLYTGDWKNGQFSGNGTLIFTNGNRYEGEFSRGSPHGTGVVFYSDGRKYEGSLSCGQLQGQGKLYLRDGKIEEGEWLAGKKVLSFIELSELEYEFM